MKKIIIVVLFSSNINLSWADDFYFEGLTGSYNIDNVETARSNGAVGGTTFSNFGASLDYDDDSGIGFEIGKYFSKNIRIGLSYINLQMDFEKGIISSDVTVQKGSDSIEGSISLSFSPSDAKSVGIEFSNHADLLILKAHYEFNPVGNIMPYLGFGIGEADIENALEKESIKTIVVGTNYRFSSSNGYAGIRFSRMEVDGPVDRLGISYQDIDLDAFELIFGTRF